MSDSFATPWTAAHQAPLSIRFSRQGYWNGLPFPSPGDLPNPGIEPRSPALQADSLPTELRGKLQYFLRGKNIIKRKTEEKIDEKSSSSLDSVILCTYYIGI